MERLEQLLRESLQARAQDVEPTPALWLEVDRRIARRRRVQVLSWSFAGAAAVVAAVLALPAVLGVFDGPDQLDIAPLDRAPAAGVVPERYVADVDGRLELRDLATGEAVPVPAIEASGASAVAAREVEVRPGSTGEDHAVVAVRGGDGDTPSTIELLTSGDGEPDADGRQEGPSYAAAVLPWAEADPGFATSAVWAPDRDAVALTVPTAEADGALLTLWESPSTTALTAEPPLVDAGVVLATGAELLDWVGATADPGDESVLYVRQESVVVAQTLVRTVDAFDPVDSRALDGVLDVASSHANPGTLASAEYLLRAGGGGPELTWSADGDRQSTAPLGEVLDGAPPASLWLDAKQDAAIVGDGRHTALVVHDGDGRFLTPVTLPTSGRAALLDAARPGGEDPAPSDPIEDPGTPDTDTATSDPEVGTDAGPTVDGAALPAPIVTVSADELTLHTAAGPQVVARLAGEGESRFLAARVRPGSTVDDLTVVALTTAEGMYDLRTVRFVDGQLTVFAPFEDGYGPGATSEAGDLQVFGPVWSPDGASLAWLDVAAGVTTLRTVGWGGDGPGTGDPATDNAAFELDTRGQVPLVPSEWVATPDGAASTELRFAALDAGDGWYALAVDVQADGAVALPSGELEVRGRGDHDGAVLAVASDDTASPRWVVHLDDVGAWLTEPDDARGQRRGTSLPPALLPGDGLAELWVRSLGDGALVGSRNTATAYFHPADDVSRPGPARLPGEVVAADVVR
jgi:hypothetical protein